MDVRAKIKALPYQIEFSNLLTKFSALVAGYGAGKTKAVTFRTFNRLKIRDYAVVCVVAPTYGLLEDVNIPDIEDELWRYNIEYSWLKSRKKIFIKSGGLQGEIWFRSADRPEKFVGFEATDMIIDEYDILKPDKQKDLWIKSIARTRKVHGSTIGVVTTPEGFRETYSLFAKKKIGPLIKARTMDNPFLPSDYIESLYGQYDEQLVKQYINGEFVNVNGLAAYYGFNRDKNHLSNNNFERKYGPINDFKELCIGMDFNVKKMMAELFVHIPYSGRIHFFDEIKLKSMGYSEQTQTQKMCEIIKEKYPGKQYKVYPDATGKHGGTSVISSDLSILNDNGFKIFTLKTKQGKRVNPFVRDRLNAANKKLGDLSVTVDTDKCPDLTEDFERVERDEYGDIDKTVDDLTHSSDAATYPIAYLYPIKKISHASMIDI